MKQFKIHHLIFFNVFFFCISAYTAEFDVYKFRNDKEVKTTAFSIQEAKKVTQRYPIQSFREKLERELYLVASQFNREQTTKHCDIKFAKNIEQHFLIDPWEYDYGPFDEDADVEDEDGEYELAYPLFNLEPEIFKSYLKLARINNSIDDIMYDILQNAVDDVELLKRVETKTSIPSHQSSFHVFDDEDTFIAEKNLIPLNNLPELYGPFKTWPDNIKRCTRTEYKKFLKNIKGTKRPSSEQIKQLNTEAYLKGYISLKTFHRLSALPDLKSVNYPIAVKNYFKTVQRTKNTLIPETRVADEGELSKQYNFSSQKLYKRSKLTRRKSLLYKYDSTQIIMMAHVLRDAARRMGSDPDYSLKQAQITLSFGFDGETTGSEDRNYVEVFELSMQDQYNLARNLLQRDIKKLSRKSKFAGVKPRYEEIIMAALETGYITHEDIEMVLQYDDIFNPRGKSRWQVFKDYMFRVLGISSIFLPPPWNITSSVALVIIEGLYNKNEKEGADHEHLSSIIR